jgi:hypothetical protein
MDLEISEFTVVAVAHYRQNGVMSCFAETWNSKGWTESRRPVTF